MNSLTFARSAALGLQPMTVNPLAIAVASLHSKRAPRPRPPGWRSRCGSCSRPESGRPVRARRGPVLGYHVGEVVIGLRGDPRRAVGGGGTDDPSGGTAAQRRPLGEDSVGVQTGEDRLRRAVAARLVAITVGVRHARRNTGAQDTKRRVRTVNVEGGTVVALKEEETDRGGGVGADGHPADRPTQDEVSETPRTLPKPVLCRCPTITASWSQPKFVDDGPAWL